jgi:hypothetical protein
MNPRLAEFNNQQRKTASHLKEIRPQPFNRYYGVQPVTLFACDVDFTA